MKKTLWESRPGDDVTVEALAADLSETVKHRLRDIGIAPAAILHCLRRAPFGGPLVVLVADCVYTLDQQIASQIFLKTAG